MQNRYLPFARTRRIYILFGIVILLFLGYGLYLYRLQIVLGTSYKNSAEATRQRIEIVPAVRGSIFDRHFDAPLVTNRHSFALDVIPNEVAPDEREGLIARLAELLKIAPERIVRAFSSQRDNYEYPIEIMSSISLNDIDIIAEQLHNFPGIYWREAPIRQYSQKQATSHILGYVGQITPRELQVLFNKGYNTHSILGKSGIERQYDELLRGEDGQQVTSVDVKGVNREDIRFIPPKSGYDLVLTIDRNIQQLVVDALGERIGAIVVLKPANGEILAMASYPNFNPNLFYTQKGGEAYRDVTQAPHSPFINRAIQASFAPASAFKVLMTTALLNEGLINVNETIYASPTYHLGNRVFHDWYRPGFGYLNIYDGLANSSNVFFWKMGVERLGSERIIDYSYRFGFGALTGIDLLGETPGIIPTAEWKQEVFQEPWVTGDTANLSIGQGFLAVTPLQIANMLAMIVNDGVIYRPYILKEIRDHTTGQIIEQTSPEMLHQSNISPDVFDIVQRALRQVITDGTAKSVITTRAVEIAGKTGTGQVSLETGYHSWFVAYAPYDTQDPDERVVVSILIDAKNEWEWWAPKAANIILHGIFTNKNYIDTIASLR